jgi:hypothetical protein
MGKTALFLLPLLLIGCDKKYNEIIEVTQNNYQVNSISPSDSVRYSPSDSLVTIKIDFNSSSQVNEVFCSIFDPDGFEIPNSNLQLLDNGNSANGDNVAHDNSFANKILFSRNYTNGYYTTKYFVLQSDDELKQVAIGKFKYDNGQANIAPVISNLVIPDTIARGVDFVFSVKAFDSNGQNDIQSVYFDLYRPDGSIVSEGPFIMHDDGDSGFGDATAGDGIYSFKNSFGTTAQTGEWKFIFQSKDRSNSLSNTIVHYILVQ